MSTEIMPGTETNRVAWADILKGLGILAVVWGHAGSKTSFYMFWFHMPLFFFISGYLYRFRPHQTWYSYVRKKARHLLVPYLFYLVLITLVMIGVTIWKEQSVAQFFAENWQALILGGSLLAGVYATFWFVTCLFFVQIAFDYLNRKVSSGLLKACVIVGCLLLSYWESRYHQKVFIPWNLDVGLYAIFFYALGYLLKNKGVLEKSNFRNIAFGISLALALGFLYLYTHHILDYGLDMKHRQYYYFGSNILYYLNMNVDLLLIGRSLGATPLGYYQNARSLTDEIRGRIAMPLQRVLFPAFSALQNDQKRLQTSVMRAGRLLAAIIIPVGVGLSAIAQDLVPVLYGPQWLAMIPLLSMFGISGAIRGATAISSSLFNAMNQVPLAFKYNTIGTLLTASAIIVTLPYGIEAVTLAVMLSNLYALVTFRIGLGLIGLHTRHMLDILGYPTLAATGMWIAVILIRTWTKEWINDAIILLLLHIFLGATFYISALLITSINYYKDVIIFIKSQTQLRK